MMEMEDNAGSVQIEDFYDLRLFFIIGTSHTTWDHVKCGSYSTIQTNTTYLCKHSLRKTFKTLSQCEKHAVQFLIMIIYTSEWRTFTLEFVHRTLKIGGSSLTTNLFVHGCRTQFGRRTMLHHSEYDNLEEKFCLGERQENCWSILWPMGTLSLCLKTVKMSSYPAGKLKLTLLFACKLSLFQNKKIICLKKQ